MDKNLSSPVLQIVAATNLGAPDGRPLHRYPVSSEQMDSLREMLRARFLAGNHASAAASFVFWAAEHFRANFPDGDYRRWDFVFAGLGVRGDDNLGRLLVEAGLSWWKRPLRRSDAGRQMYVYSLLAEGGIPQSLLAQDGLYQRVLLGLVADLETEGGIHAASLAERISARWVAVLPQTFQTDDFVRLLAELALALTGLRADLPEELSGQAAQSWLDRHRPGWADQLPLRMSPQIAEQLIRPALSGARGQTATIGPLASRELRRDESGRWHWFLRLRGDGFLPHVLLSGAADLRFRLVPVGASGASAEAPVYAATPDQGGWQLRRIGRNGPALVPLDPDAPFVLGAFADGQPKGEVVVTPSLPDPADAPSLWRAADPADGDTATRLVVQPGSGRTTARCIWLLAPETALVTAEPNVLLFGPQPAAGGTLWRLSGKGTVSVETHYSLCLETSAQEESAEARLVAAGEILRTWRTERERDVIYLGPPSLSGEIGTSGLRPIANRALRRGNSTSRRLGQQIIEWVERGEVLARLRVICLPATARLAITEIVPGQVRLTAVGLPRGLQLTLRAGTAEARMAFATGAGEFTLTTTGAPAGQLTLRLTDLDAGTALELVAPWPARAGLILDPDGQRLERDQPIAAEAIRGWRGIVPEGVRGSLALRLMGQQPVALPVSGEAPLYQYVPLIRALLAQGGPDAQVNLNLLVNGQEGRRLEIRRYHDHAMADGDRLWAGLPRDTKTAPKTAFAEQFDRQPISLQAVDLQAPDTLRVIDEAPTRNLRLLLAGSGGPWLIQSRLERKVQRAVVWAPSPTPRSTRDERIAGYTDDLQRLLAMPESAEWDRLRRLIVNLGRSGDAGVADQVQALAQVPAVAVALALRAPLEELPDMLSLDAAAPLFWPTVPLAAFVEAIRVEHTRRQQRLMKSGFEPAEARDEAGTALARRIAGVLAIHPELEGHFCAALFQAGLNPIAVSLRQAGATSFVPNPLWQIREHAQVAARRFDRLPTGIGQVRPRQRPEGLTGFNGYLQAVIDAPWTAAEFATCQRSPASARELIALINLRLVDQLYFDAALPVAIALALQGPGK